MPDNFPASIEFSRDMAVFIDKCVKHSMEAPNTPLQILGIYTMIPPEQLAEFSKRLQSLAYGDKWVTDHAAEYELHMFERAQTDLKQWFKDVGIRFERVDKETA